MDVLYIKSSVGRGLVDQGLSVAEVGSLVCLHMIVIEKKRCKTVPGPCSIFRSEFPEASHWPLLLSSGLNYPVLAHSWCFISGV